MTDKIKEKLQALFAQYAKSLPDKINSITKQWEQLTAHWDEEIFADFHRNVHNLCGSAGTYGFIAIGKSARDLETLLKQLLLEEKINPSSKLQITELLQKLITSHKQASSEQFVSVNFSQDVKEKSNTVVYLYDQNKILFDALKTDLSESGFQLYLIKSLQELKQVFTEKHHTVVLINLDEIDPCTVELLSQKSEKSEKSEQSQQSEVSLFGIASKGDTLTRLNALRMGCVAFFQKPIDITLITKRLNQLLGFEQYEPYKILVIDDSLLLAEYYALILKEAGMVTHHITNPLLFLETIEEFQPDVILMDIYMPHCTGLELASILRQDAQYTRVPIIFLSMEDDRFKQLYALNLGGDDFLVKPIVPQQLVTAVISRAKRASILTSFMTKDSLTGLLNHTNLLQRLDIEIARAHRQNQILSFIMLDIDHFKQINDTYGHPVGDIVLRKLSTLLESSFRKTDIVGRYGGEEFAIIMPDTTPDNALMICNKFCNKFAEFFFSINQGQFQVTLSGGISSYPKKANLISLVNAADQALYQAKHERRNQIKIDSASR